tara:strand:- start:139495 stop:139608 length:114 start_codon:yes stop_codon:yes gene_type:complete
MKQKVKQLDPNENALGVKGIKYEGFLNLSQTINLIGS